MARKSKRDRSAAARKGWITRRRNAKGRQNPKRKRVPKRKLMYRVTVGAPYEIRKPRNKKTKKKQSPDTAAYMVRGWYPNRHSANNAIDHLEELAEAGRETVLDENPKAFVRNKDESLKNIAIETVSYDERLLGIVEETDEVGK